MLHSAEKTGLGLCRERGMKPGSHLHGNDMTRVGVLLHVATAACAPCSVLC